MISFLISSMDTFSLYLFLFFLFSLLTINTLAISTLSSGESLSHDETLISENGEYEFGFLSPQLTKPYTKYYIGIWFTNVPNIATIWVANRDSPVSNPNTSQLTLSQDGNLILLNQSKTLIWSSNFTQKPANKSLMLTLLNTGNLVLSDSTNKTDRIWQSFDHPTDTQMADQWIGINKTSNKSQSLTSWKNLEDPTRGLYSLQVDRFTPGQYVLLWNQSEPYMYFSSVPGKPMNTYYIFEFYNDQFVQKYRYTEREGAPNKTRLLINVNGQIERLEWSDESDQWILHWSIPNSCDVYSICGAFGVCDLSSTNQYCNCLPRFEPANPFDWNLSSFSGGCVRKSYLECGNGNLKESEDRFLTVPNMEVPNEGYELKQVESRKGCESICLSNCSCNAYVYKSNKDCLIWNGEVRNLKQDSSDNNDQAVNLYLRVAASDLPVKKHKEKVYIIAFLSTGGGAILIVASICFKLFQNRRAYDKTVARDGYLTQFSYSYLANSTNNFSHKLGKGSFGSVFKGELRDLIQIAVKRLEGWRDGEKQFRTEVRTLGNIQHVNLVRLRGFCVKGDQRLLVYDYMPNKSLDTHLFNNGAKILSWKLRFQIIIGVARGLTYLHEECRERIVHCDIKPENILLDVDFSPKIADFGLAKLIGRDFNEVLTTTRGTLGYLAPEWILGLPITPKADVYSYGMMLFEIISGKRNREPTQNQRMRYYPVCAAICVNQGNVEPLLDKRLNGEVNLEELTKVLRVACWCIQDNESHRPTMTQVVKVLEGTQFVGVAPVPNYLQQIAFEDYMYVSSTSTDSSDS